MNRIAAAAAVLGGLGTAAGLWAGAEFGRRLDRLERRAASAAAPAARADLPEEVKALAARMGVRPDHPSSYARFRRTGWMWSAPGAKPMTFTAVQIASAAAADFVWRARMGPAGLVRVADYAVGDQAGLEARLLGVFPIAKDAGGVETRRGEAMRYLAELPWNPDAMLFNRQLRWTVVGPRAFRVATGDGDAAAEVALELDEAGLIVGAGADARPRLESGQYTLRPWSGRFWDYARVGDRLVPRSAEVAWILDGARFVYWRGDVEGWTAN